ncbi:MAG: TetR/AcrR family transcriptional regulator [candidate division WOR-3 bacterium]
MSNKSLTRRSDIQTEDKRRRILKAALSLFLQRGFDSTTVDEVASRAGVAKGTVYLHFHDKADIYASLLEERLGALESALAGIAQQSDQPDAKLRAMIRCNLDFIAQRYSGAEFVSDSSAGHNPEILRVIRQRFMPRLAAIIQLFAEVVRAGTNAGIFRAVEPFGTAARIFGLINVNLVRRALDRRPIDPEKETNELVDLVLHGILARPGVSQDRGQRVSAS